MTAAAVQSQQQSADAESSARDGGPIVFFDGVCGLCDFSVSTLMRIDRDGKLLFATLQGETAGSLPDEQRDLNSIVFREGEKLTRKSTAVGRILKELGGGWGVLGSLLLVIPRPVRDLGYDIVAKTRYRVWGRKETCRMPTPEERSRFLD